MKKILLSIATLAFAGAVVAGATGAFFTDTETSTGNTFTAGSIDLKIDSTQHYNGMVCVSGNDGYTWQAEEGTAETEYSYPRSEDACDGTWEETDLGGQKFFNFTDLKPGDNGEDTVSLHVYGNDAWGRVVMTNIVDGENGCTEPELEADPNCTDDGEGQLGGALNFNVWLDQGLIPGFQNRDEDGNAITINGGQPADPTEGDNIWQKDTEPEVNITGMASTTGAVTYDLWGTLSDAYSSYCSAYEANGADDYTECQGLASDGRMVGSTTYYFGVGWDLPADTGNEVQSDTLKTDLSFEVVQRRNNSSKTF